MSKIKKIKNIVKNVPRVLRSSLTIPLMFQFAPILSPTQVLAEEPTKSKTSFALQFNVGQLNPTDPILNGLYGPGGTLGASGILHFDENLGVEIGVSHYKSQGDYSSSEIRNWFSRYKRTETSTLTIDSFQVGLVANLRGKEWKHYPRLRGGLAWHSITESDVFKQNYDGWGTGDSYDNLVSVSDNALGFYLGGDIVIVLNDDERVRLILGATHSTGKLNANSDRKVDNLTARVGLEFKFGD